MLTFISILSLLLFVEDMITVFLIIACLIRFTSSHFKRVDVHHFIFNSWISMKGEETQQCGQLECHWTYFDKLRNESYDQSRSSEVSQVAVYNIHSWYEATNKTKPDRCNLPPLSLAESEESTTRFGSIIFDKSFRHFDGFSTTNPASHVPRVYEIYRNFTKSDLLPELPFNSLIKGASYVARDCHELDSFANSNRDKVVLKMRELGFRVDGLGT